MMRKKQSNKRILFIRQLPVRLFMMIGMVIVVFPLLWNLVTSFKSSEEIMANPWSLPEKLHFENYVNAYMTSDMAGNSLNSVFVVIISLLLLLLLAVPAAYALSRYRLRILAVISAIYMACIFIQAPYILVPLFLQLQSIHLLDTLFGLCLVYAIVRFPFTIFLLSGFFRDIPNDYMEAAMMDGCTYTQTFLNIMVPLAKPGIFTCSLLAVIEYWNEYPIAMTLVQSPSKYTLPVGLANLFEVQRYATDWGALFAGLMIVLVPTLLVYCFTQEKLTQGMNVGGIKG